MKDEELHIKKKNIQILGLDKIKSYFQLETKDFEELDQEQLKHLFNMAKLGMQFEKEMNLSKRATEMNYLRVGKLIAESKEELKKYIKRTLPQYT